MKSDYLERFVSRVAQDCFNEQCDESKIQSLAKALLKILKEEPLLCGAEVPLQGIILQPEKIEVAHGMVIKWTTREDLEREHPYFRHLQIQKPPMIPYLPSAILDVEFLGCRDA